MVVSDAESVGASEESDPPAHDHKATTAAATIPPRISPVMRRLFELGFELRDVSFMVPPSDETSPSAARDPDSTIQWLEHLADG